MSVCIDVNIIKGRKKNINITDVSKLLNRSVRKETCFSRLAL